MFCSESGEKSAQIKQRLQDKTVQNSSKQICGWILMRDNRSFWGNISTGASAIMDLYFSQKQRPVRLDGFIYFFTLKYQFQNHFDGTLTFNKSNGFFFFPKRLFWEFVRLESGVNSEERADWFTAATNALVQLYSTVITTVSSTHLTVGGSKVAKIHKLHTHKLRCLRGNVQTWIWITLFCIIH